jgi:hypothetical protein
MQTILAIATVVTVYSGHYVGRPLYCGGTYDLDAEPWIAVPVEQLAEYPCGSLLVLRGVREDGTMWWYQGRVMDTGIFGNNCVVQRDGTCAPILFDLPEFAAPFDGLSARVTEIYSVGGD